MISIIICNRLNAISPELKHNIKDTIGSEYEIVCINNANRHYNIFQAYNEGVQRAKGDILCFSHDDVTFLNNNWSKKVEDMFASDPSLEALGVAGGHFMPNCPSSWWNSEISSMHVYTLTPNGEIDEAIHNDYAKGYKTIEVASIDGLWMCIRRKLFDKEIRFDDKTFSGFHCYDADICMQILKAGYAIKVAFDIDILHRGKGKLNAQYYHDIELWHEKWKDYLPVVRGVQMSKKEMEIHQHYSCLLYNQRKEAVELYTRLHSPEYRIGHFLLKPFRFIKRIAQ